MAGIEIRDVFPGKIVDDGLGPGVHLPQVEAADDAHDPILARDPLRLLHDVADAAVGAAGDHVDPLSAPVRDGGVVRGKVRPVLPLALGLVLVLREHPGDLAQVEEVFRQGLGLRREAQIEAPFQFRSGVGAADDEALGHHPPEQGWMGHQPGLRTLGEEGGQALGVVVVAVGQDHPVHAPPVEAQILGVLGEDAEVACVQQEPLPLIFDEAGEARLPQQVFVDEGVVVG